MSDSPKYCATRLREEQERRLREERERQAALERARRAIEEERRQKERLAQAQRTALEDVATLQAGLSDFASADAAQFVAHDLEDLRRRIRQAEAAVKVARDEDEVWGANKDLRWVRDNLRQIVARAEAAKLAAHLAREEAAVAELRQRLVALDTLRSEKFDAPGFQEVKNLLSRAELALKRKSLAEAEQVTSEARICFERHQTDVEERLARWTAEREKSVTALSQAGDRIAGLKADEVVMRWVAQNVKTLEDRLGLISSRVQSEQFAAAQVEASEILQAAEQVVARTQDFQLKEDRRQYIVNGILQVMGQMGFVVQAGSPALEHSGAPASATIIQAQRVGGGAIAVSVPQEGEIWYDVEGFPMRVEAGSEGRPVKTCDEAQEQIEKMHLAMEESFGIQMSELMWNGKDPNRISKAAAGLGGGQGAQQRGGRA